MQFRVHTDILMRHSEVFRDMFSLPQSPNAEIMDGSPIVRLEGMSGDDIQIFLSCLHDPFWYAAAL